LRIRIRNGSGFNRVSGSGSAFGIRIRIKEGKNYRQKYKKVKKFHVSSAGCSLLRAEGFSCSLNVLYGGLGISTGNLQFVIKIISNFFPAVIFSPHFWSSKPWIQIWIGTGIQSKMLDPEPMNPDPKHYKKSVCNKGAADTGR
jgi:hypothetical protein